VCCEVPTRTTLIHEVIATGAPIGSASFVTLSTSSVLAGTSPPYQIALYDEYNNPVPVRELAPQQSIRLRVDLPRNISEVYEVGAA
jgi:hypothetical protein